MALSADRMYRVMRNETRSYSGLVATKGKGEEYSKESKKGKKGKEGGKYDKLASADAVFELIERLTPTL